MERIPIKYINI